MFVSSITQKTNAMLLAKLVVDLSDLRDMRDAGEITADEYTVRENETREEFRRKEAEAFADQMADALNFIFDTGAPIDRKCIPSGKDFTK